MKNKPDLIYFIKPIGLDGPIKIGCSNYPPNRVLTLGAWSPFPLELIGSVPGTLKDEGFLHRCFADLHSHGEWFRPEPRLLDAIKVALEAGSLDALRPQLTERGSIRPKRKPLTEAVRRRLSYVHRLRRANWRLMDHVDYWQLPHELNEIVDRWRSVEPSSNEIGRLDAFLSDPMAHFTVPAWVSI